jgi:hypothetical protein
MSDETPNILACIDQVSVEFGSIVADEALDELLQLKNTIKALREQAERTNKAMVEYAARDKKHVDQLCDIRDTLKPHLMPLGEWTSGAECAIREVLGKQFGVDLP